MRRINAYNRIAASSDGDRLLTVREAAAMLGLQPSTLYAWAYARRIPVVKLGRALRFRQSVIEKLIRDSERPALQHSQLVPGSQSQRA